MGHLTIVETILRHRADFFAEVRDQIGLQQKIIAMMISSFVFLAIYGAVMGASNSIQQVISSALKLPILFLVTLIICSPSLYFFNLLFGSRQTLLQSIALILTGMTTTSVLLLSLAPITLFFLTTSSGYQFFKLLNVAVFAIAGVSGVMFLRQGFQASVDTDNPEGASTRRTLFILWIVLYGFVGTQMAWTLRPFLGAPSEPFVIVRQTGGNFYTNVIQSASDLFGPESETR
jgi:hypothetical protein